MLFRYFAAVVVALALGLPVQGCGEDESADGSEGRIARVGVIEISRSELDRRLNLQVKGLPRVEGVSRKRQHDLLRAFVAADLITAEWIEQEAARRHVEVSEAEVANWYEVERAAGLRAKAAGGESGAYFNRLKIAGKNQNARRGEGRSDLLKRKLVQRAARQAVSEKTVREYYRRNRGLYKFGERRDFRGVQAKSKAQALVALSALRRGEEWQVVSRRISVFDREKQSAAGFVGTLKGEFEAPLDKAIFRARKHVIEGPIRAPSGWYVFEVDKVFPPRQRRLREVERLIREALATESEAQAWSRLELELQETYRPKTKCAVGFRVSLCSNARSSES